MSTVSAGAVPLDDSQTVSPILVWIEHLVHAYAPHTAPALYIAAGMSAGLALTLVFTRCLWTGSASHLPDKWIIRTAAAAAPIPTYALMMIVPLDPDLAKSVLDDRIVVALAGLYGLVETLKDIREAASSAKRAKSQSLP